MKFYNFILQKRQILYSQAIKKIGFVKVRLLQEFGKGEGETKSRRPQTVHILNNNKTIKDNVRRTFNRLVKKEIN